MGYVTCLNCGWVAFEYPRAEAINAVRRFNEWLDKAPESQLEYYLPKSELRKPKDQRDLSNIKKSEIESYEKCFRCGGSYKDFRDSKKGDCPNGCTLQPIIPRTE